MSDEQAQESKDRPTTLYHYTTIGGLLGIIKSGALWATGIRYLNDTTEFTHTLDILRTQIQKRKNKALEEIISAARQIDDTKYATIALCSLKKVGKGPIAAEDSPARKKFTNMLSGIENMIDLTERISAEIYVSCFSCHKDKLSQWRGYSPNSGFCIGFNRADLAEIATALDFPLTNNTISPCIYDDAKKEELVERLVEEFESRDKEKEAEEKLIFDLLSFAPYNKHKSFEEENEWRLSMVVVPETNVEFREGRNVIIPYYPVPLAGKDGKGKLPIDSITIGPTPDMKESRRSLEVLLDKYKIPKGVIHESEIPYRALL